MFPYRKKLIKCFRNWFPVMSSCRWLRRRYTFGRSSRCIILWNPKYINGVFPFPRICFILAFGGLLVASWFYRSLDVRKILSAERWSARLFPLSSVGEEKATPYPVRNGGRPSKMNSFCNSWEFESDIFGSLLRPLTGSHKSSTLVEQKSLERLPVLLLGFSTGFHATRSSMQSSSKTAFLTYLKKFYC